MSRYVKEISEKYTVAYGFDHYTGYFFQLFDELTENDEDHLVIDECSRFSGLTNGKMIELMKKYQVNQKHIKMVMMDLPF